MGYYQGEGVLDCTYCEEDVLNTAKSNIRQFIEVIIGIALGLALLSAILSTLIGSISCLGGCLGCEACLETAACADELMADCDADCSYEEMTQDNIDRANDCVSCEGIDCFGRQGCFSCEGVGDCDNWKGMVYYTFTVSYNGNEESYSIAEGDYFYGYSSNDYYRFLGLYSKAGKQFVNEDGEFVNKPRQGMVLYPRFEEYNLGETYYFDFNLLDYGTTRVGFQVGSSMTGLPTAPTITGYKFTGWYMNESRVIPADATESREFHLSDFRISLYNENRYYMLTPVYEPIDCKVTFVIYMNGNSDSYSVEASYGDTFAKACRMLKDNYGNIEDNDWFFGWGLTPDADPEEGISANRVIDSGMTVYAIVRQAVYVNFHYMTEYGMQTTPVKLREGQTDVRFSRLTDLEGISDESTYPGYEFIGWFKTEYEVANEQSVDSIPLVSSSTTRDFYARYKKATYKLTYKAMNYALGVLDVLWVEDYEMEDFAKTLHGESELQRQPGYEFRGWRMPNGDVVTNLPAYTYGNIELQAHFLPHTYKISLTSAPGSYVTGTSNKGEVTGLSYGQDYQLVVPTRAGYVFQGWTYEVGDETIFCTDENGYSKKPLTLESLGLPTTVEEEAKLYKESESTYSITLKAKWAIQTYTVTFMKDGTIYANQEVQNNGHVDLGMITEPRKEGYDFIGWAYASGTQFRETESITSDVTLYAVFAIKKFTVTFMIETTKGGVPVEYKVSEVEWGKKLQEAVAKISGYPDDDGLHRRRVGWYRTASYTSQVRDSELITGDLTVYAKYEYADEYNFDQMGARYYYVGETVTFPTPAEQPGYRFLGWCTTSALTGTPVWKDVKITSSTAKKYYPKYEAIEYKITYQYENGSVFAVDSYKITDMANGARPLYGADRAPQKQGYDFIGWKLGNNVVTELTKRYGDVTLTAQYKAKTYNVSLLDENGSEVTKKTVTYDGTFDFGVPAGKEGYHFIGWSWTNNAGSLATDENGRSLAGKNYTIPNDTVAYPMYAVNSYTIYWWNAATDRLFVKTTAEHFSKIAFGLSVTEEGYTFVGWYTDKECTNAYEFNKHEITGTLTLYAKFDPNDYRVHFVIESGIDYEETLQYGASLADAIEKAMVLVREYEAARKVKFVHWEDKDSRVVYDADSTVPANNLVLCPKFYYPVVVEFIDGSEWIHTSQNYYYGDQITAYSYEKTGYTFKGWYSNGSLNENTRVNFPVTVGDVTSDTTYYYYAKWEANTYTINYYMDGASDSSASFKMNETEEIGGYVLKTFTLQDKPGYIFEGWYLTSDCSGERITTLDNSNGVTNPDLYKSGTIKLYGKWIKATYTITLLDTNGEVYRTIEIQYGDTLPALPTLENMNNKLFNGWRFKDTNDEATDFNGVWGEQYKTYQWTENIVLVAEWWIEE